MRVGDLLSTGLQGLQTEIDAVNGAAQRILGATTSMSTADRVDISSNAKNAASGSATASSNGSAASGDGALTGGIEGALVDLRVSKYLAVANMKVLETGEDMAKSLTDIVRPSGT
jgi:hypothetical protein